jgi:hypothetical protein
MFVEPTYLSELLDPVNRVPRREVVCQRDLEREFGKVDQCDRPVDVLAFHAPFAHRRVVILVEPGQVHLREAEAVSSILASSGDPSAYASVECVSMREEELERIMRRAGLEGEPTSLHHLAFRYRFGEVHPATRRRRAACARLRCGGAGNGC